ncbi:MAG: hypothetical protein ACR2OZ_03195 [Verrucomicrobiales bacterium]
MKPQRLCFPIRAAAMGFALAAAVAVPVAAAPASSPASAGEGDAASEKAPSRFGKRLSLPVAAARPIKAKETHSEEAPASKKRGKSGPAKLGPPSPQTGPKPAAQNQAKDQAPAGRQTRAGDFPSASKVKKTGQEPTVASVGQPGPAEKKRSVLSRMFGGLVPPADLATKAKAQEKPTAKPVQVVPAAVSAPFSPEGGKPGPDQWVVTKDESPFYSFGPHQATRPDAYLETGTVVTVLNKSWGWAEVKLADGRTGTMARDAIRMATIYDIAPPKPAGNALLARAGSSKSHTPSTYVLPSAPLPELPTIETVPPPTTEDISTSLLPPLQE